MKKVYICAPLGGDVKNNLIKVKRYTRYALLCGTAPVVPHFYALCLGGDITKGMNAELQLCRHLNVKIRKIWEDEINKMLGGNP